jgi:DNA-binding NarL/FixJ family response regulator
MTSGNKQLRYRVMCILSSDSDKRIFQEVWGRDTEIDLLWFSTASDALRDMTTTFTSIPNLIVIGGSFSSDHIGTVEAIHSIKRDVQLRGIPIVVFSAHSDPRIVKSFYDAQAACVIPTPASLNEYELALAAVRRFWLGLVRLPVLTADRYE